MFKLLQALAVRVLLLGVLFIPLAPQAFDCNCERAAPAVQWACAVDQLQQSGGSLEVMAIVRGVCEQARASVWRHCSVLKRASSPKEVSVFIEVAVSKACLHFIDSQIAKDDPLYPQAFQGCMDWVRDASKRGAEVARKVCQ